MKKITFCLLVIVTNLEVFSQSDNRLKGIEKDLERILEVTQAPGFAVAIVEGDKTIYAEGFGSSNLENKTRMDENTLLPIASVTKAFTCGLLGQLRDEGKLSFNDSPIEYVKELRFYNNELNNGVNIRDLMCHQTGIPRHGYSSILFPTYNKDSLIQRIQYMEPFTGLRQQWYYNNFMYLVQGVIAERITKKTWEENIQERFFKPLGMVRSSLSVKELNQSINKAVGYQTDNDGLARKMDYDMGIISPAGGVNSSVVELANWLKVWMNNGEFKGEQILPKHFISEAISSQSIISPSLPDGERPDMFFLNYGYGWMISSYRGHYRVFHGGNLDGFTSNMSFFPSDNIGIIVLTNQSNSSLPDLVRNIIADRLLKEEKIDWARDYIEEKKLLQLVTEESEKSTSSFEVKHTLPSHKLERYQGNYFNPSAGRFNITTKGDSLFANFKFKRFYLKHVHYDVFQPIEITKYGIDSTNLRPLKFLFTTNESGEVASVKMKFEEALDHPIEFIHEPYDLYLGLEVLNRYIGDYDISGTIIKIFIKNNHLYMSIPNQPEYQLLASEKNLFIIRELEGYKVKFSSKNEKNTIELILIQANESFKAKKVK